MTLFLDQSTSSGLSCSEMAGHPRKFTDRSHPNRYHSSPTQSFLTGLQWTQSMTTNSTCKICCKTLEYASDNFFSTIALGLSQFSAENRHHSASPQSIPILGSKNLVSPRFFYQLGNKHTVLVMEVYFTV